MASALPGSCTTGPAKVPQDGGQEVARIATAVAQE